MKRSLFSPQLKTTLLAVPAAALMLGAAQAGTTIGLNVEAGGFGYGYSVGSGYGYQTTGFPVSATAFGVSPGNWNNLLPTGYNNAWFPAVTTMGSVGVTLNAANSWGTGIGWGGGWVSATVSPGNDEVTWGILDNLGWSVDLTGLNAQFPNGYVVGLISAGDGKIRSSSQFTITSDADSSTLATVSFNLISSNVGLGGSPALTNSAITLSNPSRDTNASANCSLAGFILTDKPVVWNPYPATNLVREGGTFILNGAAIGIGNLSYQWRHNGTNIPDAVFPSYTNSTVASTDGGNYQVVVTSDVSPSLSTTSSVLTVSVILPHAARNATWDTNTSVAGAQDGSGTWSLSLSNWWSGSYDDYWGSADTAVFGAGGIGNYTVTLADNITASGITFNTGAYIITNSSGQTLTLAGNPALTATTNGAITVPVTVSTNTLVKLGTGTVTLTGALTGTNVFVGAGTLEVGAKTGGDATYTVTNGAKLKIGYSTGTSYANTGLNIYGDGVSATTGLYLKGGTKYNVSGGMYVYGSPTTIRQYGTGSAGLSIFDVNGTGLSIAGSASGSALDSNVQLVNGGYGMAITTAAGTNTSTGDLIVNAPLNVGSLGLFTKGSGSVRLNGVAAPGNLALNIIGGTVICGAANCIGSNAVLNATYLGTVLALNGYSQTVSNFTLGGTAKMVVNKGSSPNVDVLASLDSGTAPTLGGTLVVTNIGSALAIGDSFKLFKSGSGSFSGGFTNVVLPALTTGQGWSNNLAVDGTIYVVPGVVPPSITSDLSGGSYLAYAGATRSFTVVATGDPTLHYVWLRNGITHVGTDSPTLVLSSVTTGNSGAYTCTVTNSYGSATSQQNNLTVVAAPDLASATVMQDAPGAYWPLNETNGSTVYDYSGMGNNGTQNGGLTLGVAGPRPPVDQGFTSTSLGYQFDGSSTYISCDTSVSLSGTTDFSLEAWVNTTNNTYGQIIQQRSSSGFNGEYQFGVNANGTLYFMVYGAGVHQFDINSPVTSKYVNDGNWHHVVAVRSGLTGTIYIDGAAVATASGSSVAPLDSTLQTYIGSDQRGSSSYFNGEMADVAIYTHALTAAQVANHAQKGVLASSSFAVTASAGGFIEDSKPVGTPHPGLNYGTTWLATVTDNAGTPVTRTGVQQFPQGRQIAIPANPDFNTTNGTICFWMLAPSPLAGRGTILFDRRTSTGTLLYYDVNGTLYVQTAGGVNSFSGGTVVADGNWHHVALTYDQSSGGSLALYVDGNAVASQANSGAWIWPANQPIELGRSHDTYWQNYNGLMNDFRIYSRVLNATEIGTVYSSDALVDTSTLKVRYNFGTAAGVGSSLSWPVGVLQSSAALAPASWTSVSNVNNSLPFLQPSGLPVTTNSTLFYRAGF
jgi:Concanavalin A-like lectin/glucanases superfamily/Immunoglobulin domain